MQVWKLDDGRELELIMPEDFYALPLGTQLYSIFGEVVEKAIDSDQSGSKNYIDMDTRGGYMAYGKLIK